MAWQPDCLALVMNEEKSLVCPVLPLGTAPRSSMTCTPSFPRVFTTIWPSPLPYVVSSDSTNAQFGFRTFAMYSAPAGPWSLSFPLARNQCVQPCVASVGLVADHVTNGIPALS